MSSKPTVTVDNRGIAVGRGIVPTVDTGCSPLCKTWVLQPIGGGGTDYSSQIATLQGQVATLNTMVTGLQSQINAINTALNNLTQGLTMIVSGSRPSDAAATFWYQPWGTGNGHGGLNVWDHNKPGWWNTDSGEIY